MTFTHIERLLKNKPHDKHLSHHGIYIVCFRILKLALLATSLIHASMGTAAINTNESFQVLLEEARVNNEMPGLRGAIRFSNGSLIIASTGLADVEAEIPLDNEVGMPGGSTGKTFVAALTMLLVEDGILSLDDHASKWLSDEPWFSRLPNHESIRVSHLLSHSAGLDDYPNTRKYWVWSVWRAIRRGGITFSHEELIEFVTDRDPFFAVGEGFAYSDSGYLVLGKLLESATDDTYYNMVDERILEPQALDQVRPANVPVLENVTPGYMRGARNLREDGTMKISPTSEWTGGGLVTNPTMLVKFYAALANGDVVSADSYKLMTSSGWQNPETPDVHYGFGLFVHDDGAMVEHGGMFPGYRTHVRHYSEPGITISIQTNRDGPISMESIVDRIANEVIE